MVEWKIGKVVRVAKIRVFVTIEFELVEWMDDLIRRGVFHTRSHLMEQALKHIKKEGVKNILIEMLEEKEAEGKLKEIRMERSK